MGCYSMGTRWLYAKVAWEGGLEYVEIQNLTEFYDDNRAQLAGLLTNYAPNLLDTRGRLLPRSYDVLGLYTTFIVQKPDPDITPPMATPILQDASYNLDEISSSWGPGQIIQASFILRETNV
ncbi:mRNA cap guanine-N7 methyltransferase 2-like [Trifolium pratense]|uniref:mRNA cap guanine-N7 methyltransferase 2-like n=1 Tax=Trifolium pratense TaxID=57577 RepID=UPI001E694812|nr:mRNA cap guanine-N7 methyltransferase 2-like [Trifolium pratense]